MSDDPQPPQFDFSQFEDPATFTNNNNDNDAHKSDNNDNSAEKDEEVKHNNENAPEEVSSTHSSIVENNTNDNNEIPENKTEEEDEQSNVIEEPEVEQQHQHQQQQPSSVKSSVRSSIEKKRSDEEPSIVERALAEEEKQQQQQRQLPKAQEEPTTSSHHHRQPPLPQSKEVSREKLQATAVEPLKQQQHVVSSSSAPAPPEHYTTKPPPSSSSSPATPTTSVNQIPAHQASNAHRHQTVARCLHSARDKIAPLADALNTAISEYNLLEAEFNASASLQDQLREAAIQAEQSRYEYQTLSENLKWDLDVTSKQLDVCKRNEEATKAEIENVERKLSEANHENSVLGDSIRAVRELETELRRKLGSATDELEDKTDSLEEEQSKSAILEEDKAALMEWVEAAKLMMNDMMSGFSDDEENMTVEELNKREKERRKNEKRFEEASAGLSFILHRSSQIEKLKKEHAKMKKERKLKEEKMQQHQQKSSSSSQKNRSIATTDEKQGKSLSSSKTTASSSSSSFGFGKGIYKFFSGLFSGDGSSSSSSSYPKSSSKNKNKTLVGHALTIEEETMDDPSASSSKPRRHAPPCRKFVFVTKTKKVQKIHKDEKGEYQEVEVDEEYEEEEEVEVEGSDSDNDEEFIVKDVDFEKESLRKRNLKARRLLLEGSGDDDDMNDDDEGGENKNIEDTINIAGILAAKKKRNLADEIREKLMSAQDKSREANQKVFVLTKQNAEQLEKIRRLESDKDNLGKSTEYYTAQINDLQNRVMVALNRLRIFASERDQAREESTGTLEKLRKSEELNQQLQETLNVRNAQLLKARKQLKLIQSAIDDNSD